MQTPMGVDDQAWPRVGVLHIAALTSNGSCDESIEGANIPSGVYDNGTFVPRGQDGLKIDFDNGRVIFDSSFGANKTTLSGDYTVKDFNFYITNQTEEQLIVESKFDSNSRFKQSLGGIEPYKQVIPAIFVNSEMARK